MKSYNLSSVIALAILSLSVSLFAAVPTWARQDKQPVTNIFSPPANAVVTPSFIVRGKPQPAPVAMLESTEEPRWDTIKSLPDMSQDQTKAINKLQQQTQKTLSGFRTQMNEAQQELNRLKQPKDDKKDAATETAMQWIYPDGKPFVESVLSFESDPSKQPDSTNPAISRADLIAETQAEIDELKDKIKDVSVKASGSLKGLLSQAQVNELEMMRTGKLAMDGPPVVLVDQPAAPSVGGKKRKHDLASINAGSRVFRSILNSAPRGLIWRDERI
jgi:hypothetical protein